MGLSTTHLIIFLIIIVLIFGTKKLKNVGTDLGAAVKGFKDGMRDGAAPSEASTEASMLASDKARASTTVDVEAKQKN